MAGMLGNSNDERNVDGEPEVLADGRVAGGDEGSGEGGVVMGGNQSGGDVGQGDDGRGAKDRLLDSGEKLFSEKGFESTTVREIVKDACCNIAAVNYHFGGKDNLYVKVFHRRMDYMREKRLGAINEVMEKSSPTLEELLRVFAEAFFEPFQEGEKGVYFMNLMMREMITPKLGFETFFCEVIAPVTTALQKAFMDTCPSLDSGRAMECVHSFVAQMLHLLHQGKNATDFTEGKAADMSKGIEHIVEFTMAGIRHFAEGGE